MLKRPRQLVNRGIRFASTATGPYARKLGRKVFARAASLRQGKVIPDNLWTIEDSGTCTISNNVITWNRVSTDSFIRLATPASLSAGQNWVLSYTVVADGGQGDANSRLFVDTNSNWRPAGPVADQVGTTVGDKYYEAVAAAGMYLIRWTPTNAFNGVTFQIKDVRLYDKGAPGAYP